ncbi:response regulator transcription factor [Streptomyces sp. B21-105]|uniref:response regulator transcription factor n=1 Tax=Streptomyces sp. B21-105 TaxID=3039417 RepID=UPI002FF23268
MPSQAGGSPQASTRVLVVDEPQIVAALVSNLEAHGYEVDATHDGATALRLADAHHPDVVVLGPGLPDLAGVAVVERLRDRTRAPILVLPARQSSDETAEAPDAGADDHVTEPYGTDGLLARLRAAVRRAEPAAGEDETLVETDGFTVDLVAKKVDRAGKDVRLTPTEWHLLEVLVRNAGRLVGQKQLLQEVWGPSYGTETNYLRVYMAQLRRKLEADPSHPRHFHTEPGAGYRFER